MAYNRLRSFREVEFSLWRPQKLPKPGPEPGSIRRLALPEHQDLPAEGLEGLSVSPISKHVSREFVAPEVGVLAVQPADADFGPS